MKLDYFIGENIKKDYFSSSLIEKLTHTGDGITSADGSLTVYLPPKLGFCHGVVRSIRMAMYAAKKYEGRNIYLINEMIHNPFVNRELQKQGIRFLNGCYSEGEPGFGIVTPEDVVIVPAFGGTTKAYKQLTDIGCTVIDTTCGEVASVWKRIQKRYNTSDYTTIVFGKHYHEETIATSSRAERYIIAKDLTEIQKVADFIRRSKQTGGDLLTYFQDAYSPGFNPEADLECVGMASQTTMYANEFITASNMIKEAMEERYGTSNLDEHFLELDTICSATQERQDALQFLLPNVNLMIVVGGYNSSNTANLAKISSEKVPTYHVEGPGKLSSKMILHQPLGSKQEVKTKNWLPNQPNLRVGLSSGASTPDSILEQVIQEVLSLRNGVPKKTKPMTAIPNKTDAIIGS